MPNPGPKAQASWAGFKESWEIIMDVERRRLKSPAVEPDKAYDLTREELRQMFRLV